MHAEPSPPAPLSEVWSHHWARLCNWVGKRLSSRAERARLEHLLANAASYDEWHAAAACLDKADSLDLWAREVATELYDYRLVQERTNLLRMARKSPEDVELLRFLVRTSLQRNLGGILNPRLYGYARAGTKELISEFLNELVFSLETICTKQVLNHGAAAADTPFSIQNFAELDDSEISKRSTPANKLRRKTGVLPNAKKDAPTKGHAFETDANIYRMRVRQVLNFLHSTRQSHGRTALLLSGGGSLAMYHAGVVKCLWENNLLPRIISGGSGGSIVAALVCTHTEEEFQNLFVLTLSGDLRLLEDDPDTCFLSEDSKSRNLSATSNDSQMHGPPLGLRRETSSESSCSATDDEMYSACGEVPHEPKPLPRGLCMPILRNIWVRLSRFLTHGEFMSLDALRDTLRSMFGDMTFLEAYNRTRRILNITVAAADVYEMPSMLNFVTSPEVVVWSAVLASSAIPIIVKPMPLMAKAKDGSLHVWNADTHSWTDGSVHCDLPIRGLTVQFGVNHFIVSQVNPHVAPLLNRQVSRSLWRRTTEMVLGFAAEEIELRLQQLEDFGMLPWVLRKMRTILFQKYRGDITIVPDISGDSVLRVLSNPTSETALDSLRIGVEATLPKIALIHNSLLVEAAIDRLIYEVRMLELDLKSHEKILRRSSTNV